MRRSWIVLIAMMLLLSGCWDQMPLRNIHLVEVAAFDSDKEENGVIVDMVVTKLKKAGQGEGEPKYETSEIRSPHVIQAVGQGEYRAEGPFLGVNTRAYLMSEKFASGDPIRELAFFLHAPYASINAPIIICEGATSKFLKGPNNQQVLERIHHFIRELETNGIMPNVTFLDYLLSSNEPLEDLAIPLMKQSEADIVFDGALLFRHGRSSEVKLNKEQVRSLMMMAGFFKGRQRFTGELKSGSGKSIDYGFFIKRGAAKKIVNSNSGKLPDIQIRVRLYISAFELGEQVQAMKTDYVSQMERQLSDHFEELAVSTIRTMQQANSDVLGIGKQLRAYHPDIWSGLDWRKDYSRVTIRPDIDIKILNSDTD
jgi:spore germination protein KC